MLLISKNMMQYDEWLLHITKLQEEYLKKTHTHTLYFYSHIYNYFSYIYFSLF